VGVVVVGGVEFDEFVGFGDFAVLLGFGLRGVGAVRRTRYDGVVGFVLGFVVIEGFVEFAVLGCRRYGAGFGGLVDFGVLVVGFVGSLVGFVVTGIIPAGAVGL
jgi:hypothetical protein